MLEILLVAIALLLLLCLTKLSAIRTRVKTLSRVDAKIDALLEEGGVSFDPFDDVPSEVADAIRRGRKMDAIKMYRSSSGRGLKESKEYVEEVQRRRGLDR